MKEGSSTYRMAGVDALFGVVYILDVRAQFVGGV